MEHQERIVRLEETVRHHRELTDFRLYEHDRRLIDLEDQTPEISHNHASGLKLLLAVGLTLLAFLITGDPKTVASAARLGLGLP